MLFSSPEKRNVVLGLLLIVATLALYNPVIHHPFVNFDDDRYVTDNVHVRAGLQWQTVKWAFTTFDEANWHPLTWLSHALDYQLFGDNAAGHHYTNVLLHAMNAVLVFWVLWQTTGSIGRSWMVAALFALHPINVESVAWVAERKNVLSMLFFLLALGAYGWYARRPALGRYLAVAGLFACGLMAKPMVITLPLVLLLWDYWPLQRMRSGLLTLALEKVPLLALSAVSAVITLKAQQAGGAMRSVEFPIALRLQNAAVSYVDYLAKTLWPSRLALYYPHPQSLPLWSVSLSVVILIAITVTVIAAHKQRYLAVGWLWFLVTLVPMIGIVQVGEAAMADRYAYLSVLGLFIMTCWGAADLAKRWHLSPALLVGACVAILMTLTIAAHRQVGYWRDGATLWTRTLQVTGPNFVAEDNLGLALVLQDRAEDAIPHFRSALQIKPQDPVANLNVAVYEQRAGDLQPAIARYQSVLKNTPDLKLQVVALSNLGSAYRSAGDYARARESYEAALRLMPDRPDVLVGLGLVAQKSGDLNLAIARYTQAMAIQPSDVGYLLLTRALRQNGQASEADATEQKARRLSTDFERAHTLADGLLGQ